MSSISAYNDLKQYSYISTLNIWGITIDPGGIFVQTSGISLLMQNVWDFDKVKQIWQIRFTDSALYFANQVIDKFPNFPFGYYSKAELLLHKNGSDVNGLIAAIKAMQILQITTSIYGHHPIHDQVLADLTKNIKLTPQ